MGEVRFMISEAAKKVQVESHVLRYWEDELHIPIGRTEMGHRYYTQDDIQLFCCIKKLKNEGVLLRDLKPLIPELKSTRQIMRHAENKEKNAIAKTPAPDKIFTLFSFFCYFEAIFVNIYCLYRYLHITILKSLRKHQMLRNSCKPNRIISIF